MAKCINGCIKEGAKSHGMCSNCLKRGGNPPKRRNSGWQINNDAQKMCSRCKAIFPKEEVKSWTHKARCLDCQAWVKRDLYLKQHYKINIEQYNLMLAKSNNGCTICGKTKEQNRDRFLSVDHDHSCCNQKITCGKCIRGLLCDTCNRAVGLLQDNEENAFAVYEYIKKSKKA
jgi:hypothetical protein